MKRLSFLIVGAGLAGAGLADTKGLNQVVTPRITAVGTYVTSFQIQHQAIGDIYQAQLEFGIFRNDELTVWQSFDRNTLTFANEFQVYQKKGFQLSAGSFFAQYNWTPFLIGGYRKGPLFLEIGGEVQSNNRDLIWGGSYDINPKVSFLADYISGPGNAITGGLNINLTDRLSINPALYYLNTEQRWVPYFVVSYQFGGN